MSLAFHSRPLRVLRRTFVLRVVYCLALLPLAALSALAAYAATEGTPNLATAAVFGGIAFGLLALLVWLFRREGRLEIRLHEEGIVAVAGEELRELRWDEIELVWLRAIRVQAGGLLGAAIGAAFDRGGKGKMSESSTNISVRLAGGGRTIKLTSNYRGVVAALELILQRVNPRLVADCLRRVEEGRGVAFGKVTLSPAGVRIGKRAPIALADIEQVAIVAGRLKVKQRGAWLAKASIPVQEIPNVTVLTEAFDRLRGRPVTGRTEIGRNLASRESL